MGFGINEQFSNDQNAVVIIDEGLMLMLVAEDFFKQNTGRDVTDTTKVSEVSLTIQVANREEVDKMFEAAIAAGGKQAGETVEEAE
jgi:predicted lactoylglutathione lyase